MYVCNVSRKNEKVFGDTGAGLSLWDTGEFASISRTFTSIIEIKTWN